MKTLLIRHKKVNYGKVDEQRNDLFSFQPIYDFRSADGLLEYLEIQITAQVLGVRDLKE